MCVCVCVCVWGGGGREEVRGCQTHGNQAMTRHTTRTHTHTHTQLNDTGGLNMTWS